MGILLSLLLAALFTVPRAIAQDDAYAPESVKAAYLFHFSGYVEWPGDARRPLVIGVIGDRSIAAELRRMLPGRTVQGRPVQVKEMMVADDVSAAHVLYVAPGQAKELQGLATRAKQNAVLLVSDVRDGLEMGTSVNFVSIERRIRFEVSLPAAEAAGLKLSSRLLTAAVKLKRSLWMAPRAIAKRGIQASGA